MKFGTNQLLKKTPKKLVKLGRTLMAVSAFISAAAYFSDHETVSIVAVILGALGVGFVNFFGEDVQE